MLLLKVETFYCTHELILVIHEKIKVKGEYSSKNGRTGERGQSF
jgi:hypothetical protein